MTHLRTTDEDSYDLTERDGLFDGYERKGSPPFRRSFYERVPYKKRLLVSFLALIGLVALAHVFQSMNAHPSLTVSIIIKTGATTMYTRLPYQLLDVAATGHWLGPRSQRDTISDISTHLHVASDHAAQMGGVPVIDVLANMSQKYKSSPDFAPYESLQKELRLGHVPTGERPYYTLDKYKFVSMHRLAYEAHPQADFQIAIDDDTVVFWPSLLRWLRDAGASANEVHYIGRHVGNFNYGGAGYILSRALLKSMYGSSPSPKDYEDRNDVAKFVNGVWCGDCSFSDLVRLSALDQLPKETTTHDMFFGFNKFYPDMIISPETWHHPIFTMHHMTGRDFAALRDLEADTAATKPQWDSPRTCDVFYRLMPSFLVPLFAHDIGSMPASTQRHISRIGQNMSRFLDDYSVTLTDTEMRVAGWQQLDDPPHANFTRCGKECLTEGEGDLLAKCSKKCDANESCLSWTFHGPQAACLLFSDSLRGGSRVAPDIVTGFKADRIKHAFDTMPCRDEDQRRTYRHQDLVPASRNPPRRKRHSLQI